jgi:hypothetical protein
MPGHDSEERQPLSGLERDGIGLNRMTVHPLVPAKAGIQVGGWKNWVPACAGTSDEINLKFILL